MSIYIYKKILFYVNRRLCRNRGQADPAGQQMATDPLTALAVGIVSGLAATGADQVIKQIGKGN